MSIGNGKALQLHSDTDAASPLLAWAVSSHFQVFLHSERRKTGNWTFTAALIGGKAAIASFPPLRGEENWQLQLYRRSHRRYSRLSSFPPLREEESWQLQVYRRSHRR
ncbi:hypothetical protein AAC387_Pa04g0258 [Persea americana]